MRHHFHHRLQAAVRGCRLLATAVPVLLAACGGGDDAPAPVYNLDAAMTQALAAPLLIDGLTAGDGQGNTYTLSLRFTPGADTLFEGAVRKTSQQTITVASGSMTETDSVTMYYRTGPFGQVGATDSTSRNTRSAPALSPLASRLRACVMRAATRRSFSSAIMPSRTRGLLASMRVARS